jgi:diguanylate cyclase (GGDEF)-like protein/PAS domain S-box-containing protein
MSLSPDSLAESVAMSLSAADIGVWDWRSGVGMAQANARWWDMIGYKPGELDVSGLKWYALVHEDDLDRVRKCVTDPSRQTGDGQFEIEFRMRHKAGHWVGIQSRGKVVERNAAGVPIRLAGAHVDITERRRLDEELRHAHAALQQSEARFRSLTELSSDWYWEQDQDFRFTEFVGNRSAPAYTGLRSFGKALWELDALNLSGSDWDTHRQRLLAQRPFHNLEVLRTNANGHPLWITFSGTPSYGPDGQFLGYRGVGRDITAQKTTEATIKQLAFYDVLTGLPNRQLVVERLKEAISSCRRDHQHAALLYIDLDNFKSLNDTKGHQMGDLLLQQVGTRLKLCVRGVDTVARLGGDEFVVVLKALSDNQSQAMAQAKSVAQKILLALNEPYNLDGYDHNSTPSIGATLFGGNDSDLDELLKRADLAMYQAKADGRNLLRFFDPEMKAAMAQRNALEAALRTGLQRDELCLHYQSVVDHRRRIIGVEALARWEHPTRGMISPLEFIPLAEESGLILPLGAWVLRLACQQLASWALQSSTRLLTVAVNVSARQFRQRDFVTLVADVLRDTGANASLLKLELTESLLLSDVDDVVVKMLQLKALGVGFSLDDFGTGYSSLSYLKALPLDQLKIDKSFVRDVLDDPSDAAIAVSILTLAQALDLDVVAEGVETEGQLQFLLANGCKAFQGYLFSYPVPVQQLDLT